MVDLHSHILYGWDDGAKTLEDSLGMARIAVERGTSVIAATPHLYWENNRVDPDTVRERVEAARSRQAQRYAGLGWCLNSAVPGPVLAAEFPLAEEGQALLDAQLASGALTRRGVTRVQRVAWSVADLAGVDRPGAEETDVALRLRTGRELPQKVVEAA